MMRHFILISVLCALLVSRGSVTASEIPDELKAAQIEEKLGAQVDVGGLRFTDEAGRRVTLNSFFTEQRPVILTMVYYGCPNLCGFFLTGFLETLKNLDWTAGSRFEIVTLSIDPTEDSELATAKKASYLKAYNREGAAKGWHFLTGDEQSIRRLANQVGFGYRYDAEEKQYAHSAAAIILTPDGKVSRYLHGISFAPRDLKLALLEASSGKIGTVIERALMFCYRYDPHTRGYSLAVMRVVQVGSVGMILFVFVYLMVFWRKQRRATREV